MTDTQRLPPRRTTHVVDWWRKVNAGQATIDDAIAWWYEALDDADNRHVCAVRGMPLMLMQEIHPGYVAYYNSIHDQIVQFRDRAERDYQKLYMSVFGSYGEKAPSNVSMTKRQMEVFARTDPSVEAAYLLLENLQQLDRRYQTILKALDAKGFTLRNLLELHKHGLTEVEVSD